MGRITHNDLRNFTYDELKLLTYARIMSDKLQLLQCLNSDIVLPDKFKIRLITICAETEYLCEINKIESTPLKTAISLLDKKTLVNTLAAAIITAIIGALGSCAQKAITTNDIPVQQIIINNYVNTESLSNDIISSYSDAEESEMPCE